MCIFPLHLKSKDAYGCDINVTVPCGKCIECVKDYQNSWKIRLIEECREHLYVYFFTLTYNDVTVPILDYCDFQLLFPDKRDVQLWLKKFRTHYGRLFGKGSDLDFKYFVTSEYGPNTGRPHYHGILFTEVSPTFISAMFNDWSSRFGFVDFSLVGSKGICKTRSSASKVAGYCSKYCCKVPVLMTKKEIEIDDYIKQGLIPAPFKLCSKGLGKGYVKRMKRYHVPFSDSPISRIERAVDRYNYHDGSFQYKLPRYYKDRLYRMKFPFEINVWNKKKNYYEVKTVHRYASKNPLALQMQVEIRNRILAEYDRKFLELRLGSKNKSDSEIHLELARVESSSRLARQKDIYTKLSKFYSSNRFKSRKF